MRRIFWGLADQCLASALAFGVIFAGGAVLPVGDFVQFALALAAAAFLQTACASLVAVPALYFINQASSPSGRAYLVQLLFMIGAIALLTLLAGWLLSGLGAFPALSALAVVVGACWALFDLFRRLLISANRQVQSAFVSAIGAIVVCAGMTFIWFSAHKSHTVALGAVALSYFCAAVLGAVLLTAAYAGSGGYRIGLGEAVKRHWHHSHWLLVGAGIYWVYSQGFVLLLPHFLDDRQVGLFRLLINLAGMSTVLLVWMENHYVPLLSRDASRRETGAFAGAAARLRKVCLALAVIYVLFWAPVFHLLYGLLYARKFGAADVPSVLVVCMGQAFLILSRAPLVISRALGDTRITLVAHLGCLAAVAGVGAWGALHHGVLGALAGTSLGYLVFHLVMAAGAARLMHPRQRSA